MAAVTSKDIAARLGITPSTVSRALSGSPRVSEKTRAKVLALAKELNYTPNLWAQNLVHTSAHIIGCLVLELSNPFYIPVVRAIEEVCQESKYLVFLGESQRKLEMETLVIDRFRRIRVAGIIVTPVLLSLTHLKTLEEEGTAVVLLGRSAEDFSSVNVNNVKSGELVGEHFIHLGHKHIGYVHSGEPYNTPEHERQQGLCNVLQQAGLPPCSSYVVGTNDLTGGERAAAMWLSDKRPPKAIFCSNDMLAMGFIASLLRHGIRIPEDVAVIGHDDVPFADLFKVGLTTVAYPKHEVGRIAIKMLLHRIEHPSDGNQVNAITLDPHLVIRDSCGANLV